MVAVGVHGGDGVAVAVGVHGGDGVTAGEADIDLDCVGVTVGVTDTDGVRE